MKSDQIQQETNCSLEEQIVASQSWQQMMLLPAVSAWSRTRRLFHLRIEEPTMRSKRPTSKCSVLLKFHSSKRKPSLCKCLQHYFYKVWIWGWHLLVQSFQRVKLTFLSHPQTGMHCGIQFTLIPTNTLETKRGQYASLNRDQYKVLVFC